MSDQVSMDAISDLIDNGKYEEAQLQIQKLELEVPSITDRGNLVVLKAKISRQLGKINNALSMIDEFLSSVSKTNDDIMNLKLIIEKGYSLWFRREPEDIVNLEKLIYKCQNIFTKFDMGVRERRDVIEYYIILKILMANLHRIRGEWNVALDMYKELLVKAESIDLKFDQGVLLDNIAEVYYVYGDLDNALKHQHRSMEIRKQIGNKNHIAISINEIANIYIDLDRIPEAHTLLDEGLELMEIAKVLQAFIAQENPAVAKSYLEKMKMLASKRNIKIIKDTTKLAEALTLKSNVRVREKMRAQDLLQELVDEEIVEARLSVLAFLNLCDLLLDELKFSGEKIVLDEILKLVGNLQEKVTEWKSFKLIVETYILQSKLALMEQDVDKSRNLLEEAENIANDQNLKNLLYRVKEQKDSLMEDLEKWDITVKSDATLSRELIYIEKAKNYLKQINV
jgi:tetratricopeptide (TPR) repeat protein